MTFSFMSPLTLPSDLCVSDIMMETGNTNPMHKVTEVCLVYNVYQRPVRTSFQTCSHTKAGPVMQEGGHASSSTAATGHHQTSLTVDMPIMLQACLAHYYHFMQQL